MEVIQTTQKPLKSLPPPKSFPTPSARLDALPLELRPTAPRQDAPDLGDMGVSINGVTPETEAL